MESFWLCFIPLFVAVDPLGFLPVFLGLTHNLDPARKKTIIVQSVATALAVSLLFLLTGPIVLRFIGITLSDFMIAGGVLLFILSLNDLLSSGKKEPPSEDVARELGPVPIGVPLLAGPAVFTAGILLIGQFGLPKTALALTFNLLLAGVILWFSSRLEQLLGRTGTRILSKLASLLLAAYGVMMVRKGVALFLGGTGS
ncbi:MAG: MarC family protein [Fibrobacterota bacterium]